MRHLVSLPLVLLAPIADWLHDLADAGLAGIIALLSVIIVQLVQRNRMIAETKHEEASTVREQKEALGAEAEAEESKANAAAQISEAWLKLLAPLERRVRTLEAQVQTLTEQGEAKSQRIAILEAENKQKDEVIRTQGEKICKLELCIEMLQDELNRYEHLHNGGVIKKPPEVGAIP